MGLGAKSSGVFERRTSYLIRTLNFSSQGPPRGDNSTISDPLLRGACLLNVFSPLTNRGAC